jgi:cytochrome P450
MPASESVLRNRPNWLGQLFIDTGLAALPWVFGILRNRKPILRLGNNYLVTRYDDVHAIFAADDAFGAPYLAKLDVIMGGEPFILGMADGADYRDGLAALRSVVRRADLPLLATRVEAMAEAIVAAAPGRIEVVDTLVRQVAFDFIGAFLGVAPPAGADLHVWSTRLFEYQIGKSIAIDICYGDSLGASIVLKPKLLSPVARRSLYTRRNRRPYSACQR